MSATRETYSSEAPLFFIARLSSREEKQARLLKTFANDDKMKLQIQGDKMPKPPRRTLKDLTDFASKASNAAEPMLEGWASEREDKKPQEFENFDKHPDEMVFKSNRDRRTYIYSYKQMHLTAWEKFLDKHWKLVVFLCSLPMLITHLVILICFKAFLWQVLLIHFVLFALFTVGVFDSLHDKKCFRKNWEKKHIITPDYAPLGYFPFILFSIMYLAFTVWIFSLLKF